MTHPSFFKEVELTVTDSKNSFNAKSTLEVGEKSYEYFALSVVWRSCPIR